MLAQPGSILTTVSCTLGELYSMWILAQQSNGIVTCVLNNLNRSSFTLIPVSNSADSTTQKAKGCGKEESIPPLRTPHSRRSRRETYTEITLKGRGNRFWEALRMFLGELRIWFGLEGIGLFWAGVGERRGDMRGAEKGSDLLQAERGFLGKRLQPWWACGSKAPRAFQGRA